MASEEENFNRRVMENTDNLNITDSSSQTLKFEDREVTVDDKQLKNSSTENMFFSKYEIGELIKEGGEGAVFKGEKKKTYDMIKWFIKIQVHMTSVNMLLFL